MGLQYITLTEIRVATSSRHGLDGRPRLGLPFQPRDYRFGPGEATDGRSTATKARL